MSRRFEEAGAVSMLLLNIKNINQNQKENFVLTNRLIVAAVLTTALGVNSA